MSVPSLEGVPELAIVHVKQLRPYATNLSLCASARGCPIRRYEALTEGNVRLTHRERRAALNVAQR
jgi:hypothetical protein